jgi:hypothetical protein
VVCEGGLSGGARGERKSSHAGPHGRGREIEPKYKFINRKDFIIFLGLNKGI